MISRRFLACLATNRPLYNHNDLKPHYYRKKCKVKKCEQILAYQNLDEACLHFSFQSGSHSVNPRKSDKPTWDQLQNVLLRLSDSLPKFGFQKLDFTFYDDQVQLVDKIFNRKMSGLQTYMYYAGGVAVVLKAIYPLFYTQVLNLTPLVEDGTVRGRCRTYHMNILELIFNITLRFKWKYEDLKKVMNFTDTIHIFHVDGHGLVYRHVVDRSWRRFTFFDRDLIREPENPENPFLGFQDLQVQCCVDGRDSVFIAETDATIHQILNCRDFETRFFRAYKILLYQVVFVREKNLLVTVGEDLPGVNPLLKTWNLDQIDKDDVPFCLRCSRVSPGSRVAKVTALAAIVNFIAVGFEDSSVLLFRGDVSKEKQNKPITLRDGLTCTQDGTIVALAFAPDGILYVGTSHVILVYSTKDKDSKLLTTFKENVFPRCWTLAGKDMWHQFVVARREGVYFYQSDLKAAAHLFDGEKVLIKAAKNHLMVIYRDVNTVELEKKEKMNLLTIYDIKNSYIAFSAPVPEVLDIFYQWSAFFVVTKSGHLWRFREKDINSKLDILFKKNLYDLAVRLAETSPDVTNDALADIYMHYGDFLYNKSDYSNAIKQYIRTIGHVEPSAVIQKFLDSQKIEQMIEYLEALHKTDHVTADHTTILLNCYTKLSDSSKIDKFIKTEEGFTSSSDYIDPRTGIKVLREAGYVDQALVLAKRQKIYDLCLDILMNDKQDYTDSLHYLQLMETDTKLENLKMYGRTLAEKLPDDMVELVKSVLLERDFEPSECHDFMQIFATNVNGCLTKYIEFLINEKNLEDPTLLYNLLELYLKEQSPTKTKIESLLDRFFLKLEFDRLLILFQTYDYEPGLLYLYDKAGMSKEVLQIYITKSDCKNVIDTCLKYGKTDNSKDLWTEALWFLTRCSDLSDSTIRKVLDMIKDSNAIPLPAVVEILSHSSSLTLGALKDYLLDWLRAENNDLDSMKQQMDFLEQEILTNQSILDDIENNPQVFQNSKCTACDAQLEAPTVNFLCKHSYHQHCFESYADNEDECPACAPEIKKLQQACSQQKDLYSQFKVDLSKAEDPITVLAQYIGRGIFQDQKTIGLQKSVSVKSSPRYSDTSSKSKNPFGDVAVAKNPFDEHGSNPFDED